MKLRLPIPSILGAAVAAAIAMLWSGAAQAEDSVEVRELKAALEIAQKQIDAAKADAEMAEQRRRELVDSLAESVRVSEEQVARAHEIELKLQAFGIDLFNQEDGLEQRLLKAVRDLDIIQQDLEASNQQLRSLSESFLAYLAATPEAGEGKRKAAEEAIRSAGQVLSGMANDEGTTMPGDLSDTQVVSIDPEIGLVVVDAGRRAGLRVGTPISILREDRPIYSAMVIDVRDSIAGAVLQDRFVETGTVAVGDGIELLPNQPSL
ncbi:MAG: hypothetical protein AAF733_03820 [Verrucomicrobiota bacterium]